MKATPSAYVLAVLGVNRQQPEDPRVALRRIIGGITVVAWVLAGLSWVSSGSVDWTLVGFAGTMWAVYSFLATIADTVSDLGRFVVNQFTGNVALPVPQDTIDAQTDRFERMLAEPLERHREILIGIRLAEIYRTHRHDEAKSTALLDRLRAKYPDAPELIRSDQLGRPESIEDQAARYEQMLAAGDRLDPHQAVMVAIRLAEIYRTLRHDDAKADALLARIRAAYPNAPELSHDGPG